MAEVKIQVDNVFRSHIKIEWIISMQIAHTTEQVDAKESSTLVTYSLHAILQCSYEIARTDVFFIDIA